MDPDGSLGVRQWFESPYRDGEIITVDEYYQWIFENSVPGLPEAASAENLTPLEYMRKYGAFEVTANKRSMMKPIAVAEGERQKSHIQIDERDRVVVDGQIIGVMIDGEAKVG